MKILYLSLYIQKTQIYRKLHEEKNLPSIYETKLAIRRHKLNGFVASC
jgi:hypothetical protein